MKIRQLLESAPQNAFKALFIAGPPGAGKSTLLKQAQGLPANHVVITMDDFIERQQAVGAYSSELDSKQTSAAKTDVEEKLKEAINQALPVIIDTAGADEKDLAARKKTLEAMGYDTAIVWMTISYEQSLERVKQREQESQRTVATNYLKQAHEDKDHLAARYQDLFGDSRFTYIDMSDQDNYDQQLQKAQSFIQQFFSTNINNNKGQQLKQAMDSNDVDTIYPGLEDDSTFFHFARGWYKRYSK